jgi:hypothetical protein
VHCGVIVLCAHSCLRYSLCTVRHQGCKHHQLADSQISWCIELCGQPVGVRPHW